MQQFVTRQKATLIFAAIFLAALVMSAACVFAGAGSIVFAPSGYWDFNNPLSLYVNESGISVLDDPAALVTFSHDGAMISDMPMESGARKALSGSVWMTALEVAVGGVRLPITADDIALGSGALYIASGNEIHSVSLVMPSLSDDPYYAKAAVTAVAAYGTTVYYTTESGGSSTLYRIDDGQAGSGTEAAAVKIFSGSVDALTCLSATEICFSSGAVIRFCDTLTGDITYSEKINHSEKINDFVTGIYAHGASVYFLTSGGDVRVIAGKSASTILITSASSATGFYNAPTAITSRKDTVLVADRGNDRVTVLRNSRTAGSIKIYGPNDAAIDYSGNIYVASSSSVKVYNSQLDPVISLRLTGNIYDIVSIAVDYSQPIGNDLYAVTASGSIAELKTYPQRSAQGSYKKVFVSVVGELYALTGSGDIMLLDKAGLSPVRTLVNCAGAVDFAVDAGGNVYVAYPQFVVKYGKNGSAVGYSEAISGSAGGINISMVNMGGVAYGDILVTDKLKNRIVKCDSFTADMNEVEAGDDYYGEMKSAKDRPVSGESIIRAAVIENSDIYEKPVEMPAKYSVSSGTKVIVIDRHTYDGGNYWFVLVDVPGGLGLYGFMNKNVLSDPYPYSSANNDEVCKILSDNTEIRKYPSVSAATVLTAGTGKTFDRLAFVDGHRDIYGSEWCRIVYNDIYEGYVLRGSVSIDGKVIIRNPDGMPKPNARIKAAADETAVGTYFDGDGLEPSGITIAVGTEVEVVGAFNLAKAFTQIKYSYYAGDGTTIVVRTCYVSTDNVYYSETTIYQILAFSAIAVIVILVILLIVIKKRKENVLADKHPKF